MMSNLDKLNSDRSGKFLKCKFRCLNKYLVSSNCSKIKKNIQFEFLNICVTRQNDITMLFYRAITHLLQNFKNWQTIKGRIQKQRKKYPRNAKHLLNSFIRLC